MTNIEILNLEAADIGVTIAVSAGGGGFDIFENSTGNLVTTCCDLQEVELTLDGSIRAVAEHLRTFSASQ